MVRSEDAEGDGRDLFRMVLQKNFRREGGIFRRVVR